MKSKEILRNQNHNELYTTPSLTGGCCIFYTDDHNVDEDLRTILIQGGSWPATVLEGITMRDMQRENFYHADGVASSNMQTIRLYGLA